MREGRDCREGNDQLRILVVDDSAVSRKLAEYAFEGKPYDLSFAEDGKRALQLISERNPDIVITDWLMPDLSGVDLCRLIRRFTWHAPSSKPPQRQPPSTSCC